LDINEFKARQKEPLAQVKCKGGRKKRAGIDKGMILTTFTARINTCLFKCQNEFFSERRAQPGGIGMCLFNTGENGGVPASKKFTHQLAGRIAP